MEKTIIELLELENKALDFFQIKDFLKLETAEQFKELTEVLDSLEKSLKIIRTKKNKFMAYKNSNLKVGRLIVNKKGFGFVDIEGDTDVYIAKENMNGAIHNDRVIVEITSGKSIDLEGRIVRIVDRKLDNVVGEIYEHKGKYYIDLDDDKLKINVEINQDKLLGAMPGHKVLVHVYKQVHNNNYLGEVLKLIGHKNDPGVDILSIAYKYEIETEFSEAVMKQADSLPSCVLEKEILSRSNHDLRDKMIFTIDGDDTKDIDDAISIELSEDGNYKLGVHIADVSYYVTEGSPLDLSAQDRGTSVYLADRVIPMLPHKLSNGICSLNPGVDRLAITCEMVINKNGKVIDYDIYESVICSRIQMTYKKVNQYLEEGIIPEGYEEYTESLTMMADLASILRASKIRRGYLDFNIDEAKIIVDDNGKAIDVKLRNRGVGENLIEDFMIVANETVASHIYYMSLPFVYRIHGKPNEEKISSFLSFVSVLGHKVHGKIKDINPKTVQGILDELKEVKEFPILSKLLLRSMQKAVYDPTNIGHFGLASDIYTHFTSPIRRYPDTTVHRLLRTYLFQNRMDEETIKYYETNLPYITEHSSYKERQAVECEREVDDMKKAEYMMDHIGEEYEGTISGVMSFGMFVELDNLVEGLVRIDDLKDDFYTYDEVTYSLIGKKNKRGYRLGDRVNVIVKAASKETKTVDFELTKEK
ncbi:MAG: ribonuclease R [Firmicutes bacterium]|nr:ribonuclease R [Bacillota bacterium]